MVWLQIQSILIQLRKTIFLKTSFDSTRRVLKPFIWLCWSIAWL